MSGLGVIRGGFFDFNSGDLSLEYFERYVDPYFARHSWYTLRDTMVMGVAAATGGTLNIATAYAMIVILIVLAAIGLFYFLVAHFLGSDATIDLTAGGG